MKTLWDSWGFRVPVCLGLSFNAQSLSLVEWRPTRPAHSPGQRWGQEEWAQGALQGPGTEIAPARLGAAVQSVWRRSGLRCQKLAMGLPADRVVQQSLQLDADLPDRDIRAQVNWRASEVLSLAWDQVAFDYRVDVAPLPGALGAPSTASLQVRWLACPRVLVQAAQQMSRSAGLHLCLLGLEPAQPPPQQDLAGMDAGLTPQWHLACEMARQGAGA